MNRRDFLKFGASLAIAAALPGNAFAVERNRRLHVAVPKDGTENAMPLKVVDPHVHLWDLSTGLFPGLEKPSTGFIGNNEPIARTYPLDELLGESGGAVEVIKIVNVEAFPTDTVAETAYLQKLADKTGYPQGIVAGTDLSRADAEAELEKQVAFANLRGIRNALNMHANPLLNYVATDFMAVPQWRRNYGLLAKYDLTFDMQLYPHQMDQAAELVSEYPGTVAIINHAGMLADRGVTGWREWRKGMRKLACFPNVMVKISGLGMFDHNWIAESVRPHVWETIDAFGVQRCMFASNFPVDKLFGSYADTWTALAMAVEDFSEDERNQLLRANAERIYRI